MAALIERQPSVREQYAQELVDEEVVTQEEADALAAEVDTRLKEAHERLKTTFGQGVPAVAYEGRIPASSKADIVTAVGEDRLRALNDELLAVPDGLHGQPEARASSSSAGAPRSSRAASTGARPRSSRSPACSSRGSRSG